MLVRIDFDTSAAARSIISNLQNSGIQLTRNTTLPYDAYLMIGNTSPTADWESVHHDGIPIIAIINEREHQFPKDFPGQILDWSARDTDHYNQLLTTLKSLNLRQKNPYKGLLEYSEIDEPFLFGQQRTLNQFNQYLESGSRLVALSGKAGSGKTSMLRAGLLPMLRKNPNWVPVYIRINQQPIRQLAEGLARIEPDTAGLNQGTSTRDTLYKRLYSDANAFQEIVAQIADLGKHIVFILDSCEKLFTDVPLAERVYFLDMVYQAIQDTRYPLTVCLSLRSEYETRLHEYPKWAALLENNLFTLPDLGMEGTAQVIVGPAGVIEMKLDKELGRQIVTDARRLQKPSWLSLLSFELYRLAQDPPPTLQDYEQHGGVVGSFQQWMDAYYNRLTPIRQRLVQRLLLQFVEVEENGTFITRSLPANQLQLSWVEKAEVTETIQQLLQQQVLVESLELDEPESYLRISNPVVLSEWPFYTSLINQHLEEIRYRSYLERQAKNWVDHEYAEQFVLHGTALDEATTWIDNPDHFPSPLLKNYVDVSNRIRQGSERQVVVRSKRQRQLNYVLLGLLTVAALVLVGGTLFASSTVKERNNLATVQADLNNNLSTAQADVSNSQALVTAQSVMYAATLSLAQTQQSDIDQQLATSAANYALAATAQANSEAEKAAAQSTAEMLMTQQADNQAAIANLQSIQTTLDASMKTQMLMRQYIAGSLASISNGLLPTNPTLGLRLAVEAAAFSNQNPEATPNPLIDTAIRSALIANATSDFGPDVKRSWALDNNQYLVVDYGDKQPASLWALNPLKKVSELKGPIDQVLPVGNGPLFFVDYADSTPDELWETETQTVISQLQNDIAPAPEPNSQNPVPNLVLLQNGKFFILRYENQKPSQLWETASMQPIATLDGDIDKVVPLANGYFFAHYADLALPHGVWEIETRKMVQAGDDVVTEDYDNRIFALRRKERFDEVWRTDPLRELTAVLGRVQTVTTIQGSDYFVVQYEGDKPAEIWLDEAPPKIVITLRGPIDTSITYLDQGYFFLRYNDLSRSEIWSSKPPKLLATLNGNLATTDVKAALGQEVVVFQYTDNAISELWSLKDVKPIAKLNGDAAYIKSILGDTYFVVRYRGEQPAEVWSAISGQLIGKLGDKQKLVQDVAVIQDGNYVAVFYADAPAEIWQVETNQVRLFASLPDAATNMYALNPDFFLINYKTKPAQIWQIGKDTPVLNMKDTIEQASYSYAIQWLTYTTPDQKAYGVNMGTLHDLLAGDNPPDETALITLACTQVSQNPPIPDDVLQTYLGGLPSTACLSPAAEATVEAELSEATEPAAPEVNTDTQ